MVDVCWEFFREVEENSRVWSRSKYIVDMLKFLKSKNFDCKTKITVN